jgi:hypothetical protein
LSGSRNWISKTKTTKSLSTPNFININLNMYIKTIIILCYCYSIILYFELWLIYVLCFMFLYKVTYECVLYLYISC